MRVPGPGSCQHEGVLSVSVVVTAFDQGELVAEAVESVLHQTRVPEAVLVVDDGSTDVGSVEVIERLQGDTRVRVLPTTMIVPCNVARVRAVPSVSA